ncbi:MAG: hypothetical protein P8P77_03730 [Crocinitomicaceae bacterium]|nr:hypothetical protein [Crocinitomicaceae bacterium]
MIPKESVSAFVLFEKSELSAVVISFSPSEFMVVETFLIEKWADDEFRSVNGQLKWIIAKSLKDSKHLKSKRKPIDSEDK